MTRTRRHVGVSAALTVAAAVAIATVSALTPDPPPRAALRLQPFARALSTAGAANPPSTQTCRRRYHKDCYDAAQLHTAYNLNGLLKAGYDGHGRTIAIVDEYGSPTIGRDLAAFDRAMHLPTTSLKVIQPAGRVPPYRPIGGRPGWAVETSLDVEWAHAMAPRAALLLVEVPTPKGQDGVAQVVAAERYVIDHHLADVISQSFGASELSVPRQEVMQLRATYLDARRNAVTILAATGDQGATQYAPNGNYYRSAVSSWPATDPLVTAVGGTRLQLDRAGHRTHADMAWNDTDRTRPPAPAATGGGRSVYFTRPSFQNIARRVTGTMRGVPDVALNAANSSSVLVHVSFPGIHPGWVPVGGTSEATPLLAGIIAIADQYAGADLGLINPALYTIYARHSRALTDVVRGDNTVTFRQGATNYTVTGFHARRGYDLVSGVGTLDAGRFVPALAATAPYTRTLTFPYNGPCSATVTSPESSSTTLAACPSADAVTVSPSDRYVTVTVEDNTGSAVPVSWSAAAAGPTSATVVCGSRKDMKVRQGRFTVAPTIPAGNAACPLPPTGGVIVVRLSNHA
ncbi:MAG TPA: S53 family peptidase [Mycobacteriales bacterium]|nr:S53 family peptidase [Mycobacteriales bacterium]